VIRALKARVFLSASWQPLAFDKVVANCDHLEKLEYSKALPHAFTEHGALVAASVLNTPRAIEVSVFIVRAFIKLQQIVAG
jgi:hypothetical protein